MQSNPAHSFAPDDPAIFRAFHSDTSPHFIQQVAPYSDLFRLQCIVHLSGGNTILVFKPLLRGPRLGAAFLPSPLDDLLLCECYRLSHNGWHCTPLPDETYAFSASNATAEEESACAEEESACAEEGVEWTPGSFATFEAFYLEAEEENQSDD